MQQNLILLLPIFIPIAAGILLLAPNPFAKAEKAGFSQKNRSLKIAFVLAVLGFVVFCNIFLSMQGDLRLTLWTIADDLDIYFKMDDLSRMFSILMSTVWLLAGIFSVKYMTHEKCENRFYAFYLIAIGVLVGIDFAGNFVTMYIFYEMMSLTTMPLVLHSMKKEAIMAGLKYLFFSSAGAFMALFGFIYLYYIGADLSFQAGGTLLFDTGSAVYGRSLVAIFAILIGFGVKAGMFPLHGWLPTAHPVAPAPASAVLSGVITKAGVLATIRVIYYVVGAAYIRGTWLQYAWMTLALVTVFMGSMLAYKEQVLKKRLAYSTVSQVSYILFGLSLLNVSGFVGATAHVIFHSLIKDAVFLTAGAIIFQTGKTRVSELKGIGKEMPITMWCFTFASLALIGIPPASGFISKWYLAQGSLSTGMEIYSWLGPVVLLISALLTAGYLLPISMHGFLPGADFDYKGLKKMEPSLWMLIPILILTALAVGFGIWNKELLGFLSGIAGTIL